MSLNCSMLKEESSEIIPERDSIKSLFMKYQFNEIFPLLIKQEKIMLKLLLVPIC